MYKEFREVMGAWQAQSNIAYDRGPQYTPARSAAGGHE
jgi:hypothetical protein